MFMQIKPYKKGLEYAYSFGVFPTVELMESKKDDLIKVLIMESGLENEGVQKAMDICKENGIPYEINDKAINRISKKENNYIVGVFHKYSMEIEKGNHVVLVNPSDMGNMGTIIRTSLGFGIRNIAIIRPAVDVFNPKVIRGSMGSIFKVNIEYFDSFEEYMERFPSNEVFPFILRAEHTLKEIDTSMTRNYSLVFGNEGSGLDEDYFSKVGRGIRIEQTPEVDSLNLAIAVGIALYRFSK